MSLMLRSGDFQKWRSEAQGTWVFLGFMKNVKVQLSKVCVWGGGRPVGWGTQQGLSDHRVSITSPYHLPHPGVVQDTYLRVFKSGNSEGSSSTSKHFLSGGVFLVPSQWLTCKTVSLLDWAPCLSPARQTPNTGVFLQSPSDDTQIGRSSCPEYC